MTWQWVVLILGVLAWVGFNSYLGVLKERTKVARETLFENIRDRAAEFGGGPELYDGALEQAEQRLGNGNS